MGKKMTASFFDTQIRYKDDELKNYPITKEKSLIMWRRDVAFLRFYVQAFQDTGVTEIVIGKSEKINNFAKTDCLKDNFDSSASVVQSDDVDNEDNITDGNSAKDKEVPLNESVNSQVFLAKKTAAFIGHAGWYAQNRKGILPSGPRISVDDILTSYKAFPVMAGEVKSLWLRIETNDKSSVGTEEICIDILADGSVQETLRVDAQILKCVMPSVEDYSFNVEYWSHPYNSAYYYDIEPFCDEHIEILKKHQRLYKKSGGRGVIASIVEEAWGGQTYGKGDIKYPSMIKWVKGTDNKFNFDYKIFDKWIMLNKEEDLSDKFICYSMMPWGSKIRYFDERKKKMRVMSVSPFNNGKYKKVWDVFLDSFIAHLDEKGWFDVMYMGFDERSNMQKVIDYLCEKKNKEGKTFKISASFNNFVGNKKVFDRLDCASVGLDEIRADRKEFVEEIEKRRQEEKKTSLYTATEHFPNSVALSQPAESYWTIIYAKKLGLDGFLRWAYDAWVEKPLVDCTHCSFPAGDCFLIYPQKASTENRCPQMSCRLVKLDEGVRDANKLAILEREGFKEEVQALLDSVKENYTFSSLKDKKWGVSIRTAKWADDAAKIEMLSDADSLHNGVGEISLKFSRKNNLDN